MKSYEKSLTEVWEWKEKVQQDVKDLTTEDYLEKLRGDAEKILSENHAKLRRISLKKDFQKVAQKWRQAVIITVDLKKGTVHLSKDTFFQAAFTMFLHGLCDISCHST